MSIELSLSNQSLNEKKQIKKANKSISSEDYEVLMALEKLKNDLEFVHKNLDCVTNPTLIDSYIYEIKSLNMRYQFYLQLCKEKGLACHLFA